MASLNLVVRDRLILFTRYPEPGCTKTRLIPHLGAEGAAALQRQMTEYVLTQVVALQSDFPLSVEIRFAGGDAAQMQAWLGRKLLYQPQNEGDLGARLVCAFQQGFQAGMERIVVIGSDCPEVKPKQMIKAFNHLQQNDLVLGPAKDGGYYLIGLRQPQPDLFQNIAWGTAKVFQQTDAIAQRLGLSIGYLDCLSDVDRPEDLPVWEEVCLADASHWERYAQTHNLNLQQSSLMG